MIGKRWLSTISRRRRALFNVPSQDQRKLDKIPQLAADSIVLDLEDGVPVAKKHEARQMAFKYLKQGKFPAGSERAVRINSIGSGFELDDLRQILPSEHLDAIVIPKVDFADHVKYVASLVDQLSPRRQDIKFLACIESAQSVLNLNQICQADERIDGLVFASEDFCADTGIKRTDDLSTLLYARSAVVMHAVAHRLQAIDIVCIDFRDAKKLESECENGKRMGFTGKQAIHPNQIETIQKIFVPSDDEVAKARHIVDGYIESISRGQGAFEIDGKMIDAPVLKAAQKCLIQAGLSQYASIK